MKFDWWTLSLQAVNFLVLVWLLQRFLFRPVQRLIDTRKAKSDSLLRAAKTKLAEAEAEKSRYDDLVASIEASKDTTLRDFHAQLDAERDAVMEKARESANAMVALARDEIAQDRRRAIEARREDLIGLAREIASKILASRVEEADLRSDVALALGKLAALPENERLRVLKSLERESVTVVTATPLAEADQGAISELLRAELGKGVPVAFKVKPELLGGVTINLPRAQLDASWASYLDAAVRWLQENDNEPTG